MLIKNIDEVIRRGKYDIKKNENVTVATICPPKIEEKLVVWEKLATAKVPRSQLHYNDASDASLVFFTSWQKFYAAGCEFGKIPLYSGSSNIFKDGKSTFGGAAKAAIYLRFSFGFLSWLDTFDKKAADIIRTQVPDFESMMENEKTKKMSAVWHKFKADKNEWTLPVIAKLSSGENIVFGLSGNPDDDWSGVEELEIDVPHSLELMSFLKTPEQGEMEIISELFQFGSGLGRNAFGKTYKMDELTFSEYTRLMGVIPESEREKILEVLGNKLSYRVKVAPNPDSSELIYMPEGELKYSALKNFIDEENHKVELYYEAKKQKKTEDSEKTVAKAPNPLPLHDKATIYLVNTDGSQKKKLIILQVFPSLSLGYMKALNAELLNSATQMHTVSYMKQAMTANASDTPANYRYWTDVFTKALQKQYISAEDIFAGFQRFAKTQKGDDLIDGRRADYYFTVVGKLLRLQHIIDIARKNEESLNDNKLENELKLIETLKKTSKGVFAVMPNSQTSRDLLGGDVYDLLREKQKAKIDAFTARASSGVPNRDFACFIKGALTGILLNELTFALTQAGRSFSVTQGRHPSRLRGKEITKLFNDGIGMLLNLREEGRFNNALLPVITSYEDISRRDVFNTGMLMGMVFFVKSNNDKEEEK